MLGSLPSEFIIVGWFVYCRVAYGISSSCRGSQILSKKTEVSGFSAGVRTSQKKKLITRTVFKKKNTKDQGYSHVLK